MRDKSPDNESRNDPHGAHARYQKVRETPPFYFQVSAGELYASKDQLHTEDKASEVESDGLEVLFIAGGVFERSYEVGGMWGENDASDQGHHCLKVILARQPGFLREVCERARQSGQFSHTCFSKMKLFFQEIRHKTEY